MMRIFSCPECVDSKVDLLAMSNNQGLKQLWLLDIAGINTDVGVIFTLLGMK